MMEKEITMNTMIARSAGFAATTLAMTGTSLAQVGENAGRNLPYYHGPGMMWGGGQWGGFGMVLGPIFMILVLVGIVIGVIYLMRNFGGLGPVSGSAQSEGRALAVLKERYAKGEIDSAEFDERKARLAD